MVVNSINTKHCLIQQGTPIQKIKSSVGPVTLSGEFFAGFLREKNVFRTRIGSSPGLSIIILRDHITQ